VGCKYDLSGWLAEKITPEVGAELLGPSLVIATCSGGWIVAVPEV